MDEYMQFFQDGRIEVGFSGRVRVESPWDPTGETLRDTRGVIRISPDGNVGWDAVPGSRVPAAEDTAAALHTILDGIRPETEKTWMERNCAGVRYYCTRVGGQKFSLGISADGKLSKRQGPMTLEVLKQLIPLVEEDA